MKNKQAKKDFDKLLQPFDATDIKYTSDEGTSYIANIKNSGQYDELFAELIKDYSKSEMDEYVNYTDYGCITINNNEPGYITIEVYSNEDDEQLDESTSSKKESINDSKSNTLIDNIKNWTEHDVRIEITYEDEEDDYASICVYMPETNEYLGEWELDLSQCDNQDYAGSIADEINAVDVEETVEESLIAIESLDEDEWSDEELASIFGGDTKYPDDDYESMDPPDITWYGEYKALPKGRGQSPEIKKVMFKFQSLSYNEAKDYFEDTIPEPYVSCKLLGKTDNNASVNDLKTSGFVMIECKDNLIPIQTVKESNNSINPERAYDFLDNITAIADSYDDIENDVNYEKLIKVVDRIEDEIHEIVSLVSALRS